MGHIVLLAFAAAVFPTLIACVAIIISRPAPRRLLTAFYAGGLTASLISGTVVLAAFDHGDRCSAIPRRPHTPERRSRRASARCCSPG